MLAKLIDRLTCPRRQETIEIENLQAAIAAYREEVFRLRKERSEWRQAATKTEAELVGVEAELEIEGTENLEARGTLYWLEIELAELLEKLRTDAKIKPAEAACCCEADTKYEEVEAEVDAAYEQFAAEVEAAGLTARDCGGGHWQIRGGKNPLVNVWPATKCGFKMAVDNDRALPGDTKQAILLAEDRVV